MNDQLKEIATTNGCSFQAQSETIINAPFCGIDYHVQDVCLSSTTDNEHMSNVSKCIEAFTRIESDQLADGFFEVVQ